MRSIMKHFSKYKIMITSGCLAILFAISMLNGQINPVYVDPIKENPSSSALLIDNSLITYNPIAERVVGALNVQVDLRVFGTTATKVNMTITFSNTTVQNFTLTESPTDIWKYKYIPNPTAPLNTQTFIIAVFDGTKYNVSNVRSFKIYSCAPKVGITLSTTQLYRNNTLQYNITPSDGEDPVSKLTWNIIVKTNLEPGTTFVTNSSSSSGRSLQYWFRADSTLIDGSLGLCYVQVSVTDSDGNNTISKAYFNILNNAPTVKNYTIEFSDTAQTDPEDKELLRVSGSILIKVNITDIDTSNLVTAVMTSLISLKLYAIGPNNYYINFGVISTIYRVANDPVERAHFKCSSTISKSVPAGAYKLYIVPYQVIGAVEANSTVTYDFTLVNNIPNATKIAYTINDLQPAALGLSFQEYERLTFKINVTNCDAEGVTYVKLCLVDAIGVWTNFTFTNPTNNYITFNLRARDLEPGQWIAWVQVIDGDNVQVATLNVMSFDIIPDTFSTILPWLMLLIGIIAGFIVSAAIIGSKYLALKNKRQVSDSEIPVSDVKVQSVKKIDKPKEQIDSQKEKSKPTASQQQSKSTEQKSGIDSSKRQLMRKIEPKK
jgi:hypothetical protein